MSILFITPTDATIISKLQPTQNFGPQENLFVGLSPTPNDVFRSLLNFDISSIPTGSTITNATLRLLYFQDVPGVQPLVSTRLLSSFSQNTVTWNTQPAIAGGYTYTTYLGDNLVGGYIYLDLTGLIEDWYSGLFPNNGMVLTSDETVLSLMGFKGYDDGIIPNWPTLIIDFENTVCPCTPGLSEYAYIYNLTSRATPVEADVLFDTNGVNVGSITHLAGTAPITIGTPGDYAIWFNIAGVEPNQFGIIKNGTAVGGSIYGSGAGTQPNPGMVIVSALAGDVLTLRNHSSAAAVTLQTIAGGTQANANASILIEKIS